jgi:hypothetical protein
VLPFNLSTNLQARLKSGNETNPTHLIPFEDPKAATRKLNSKIALHSQYVVSVLDKHNTYTTSRVMPINLTSEHKN